MHQKLKYIAQISPHKFDTGVSRWMKHSNTSHGLKAQYIHTFESIGSPIYSPYSLHLYPKHFIIQPILHPLFHI